MAILAIPSSQHPQSHTVTRNATPSRGRAYAPLIAPLLTPSLCIPCVGGFVLPSGQSALRSHRKPAVHSQPEVRASHLPAGRRRLITPVSPPILEEPSQETSGWESSWGQGSTRPRVSAQAPPLPSGASTPPPLAPWEAGKCPSHLHRFFAQTPSSALYFQVAGMAGAPWLPPTMP